MTTIVITATKNLGAAAPAGQTFASTSAVVTDNSGAVLPTVTLTGTETPTPWSATLTGAAGTSEAQVVFTDLDTTGTPIGSPVTVTESGTGGQPGTFPQTTGGTITVA